MNLPVVSRQGLGTSAAKSSTKRPRANAGFDPIPAHSRAFNADEELAADALKGAGQPEPTVRDIFRRRIRRGSRCRMSSAWQYRGGPTSPSTTV